MKTCTLMILMAALAASSAYAEQDSSKPKQPNGTKTWNCDAGGQEHRAQMDKRGGRPDGPMDPEMMEAMKANHKAIRELGEAARAETDPTKKEELVAQLRTKLGEVGDLMQKKWEERLAQAEERLAGLKAKIEESKTNRDALIEEQVQRILSGERPQRPERFNDFPNAKGGHRPPPPPPGEEMDDDMPPPPEE